MVEEFYNENDAGVAGWLRELMTVGLIPQGYVDERDIREVRSEDVRGYTRAHFFAGVAGWPHALRLAGWPDDRPVWTGSCPCQPFSQSGKRKGTADERHLWPEFARLIRECRPDVCFGEQVASPDGCAWLDIVSADLEGMGYAVGSVVTPAAGHGAPHARHRIYWVAQSDSISCGQGGEVARWRDCRGDAQPRPRDRGRGEPDSLANSRRPPSRRHKRPSVGDAEAGGLFGEWSGEKATERTGSGPTGDVAEPNGAGSLAGQPASTPNGHGDTTLADGGAAGVALGDASSAGPQERSEQEVERRPLRIEGATLGEADPLRGFWRGADWLYCRDGKYRSAEPGTFPLATGVPARMVRLRGYGNALCIPQAVEFIKAYLSIGSET